MSNIETKILKWCKNLHNEGLITDKELESCTHQFAKITINDNILPRTDILASEYGMTPAQLNETVLNPIKFIITNNIRQPIQVRLEPPINVNDKGHLYKLMDSSLEKDITINLINRGSTGVLLQIADGAYPGKYITYNGTKLLATSSTPTPECYFKLNSYQNTTDGQQQWRILPALTSTSAADSATTALDWSDKIVKVTDGNRITQLWAITPINNMGDGATSADIGEFSASEARSRIDSILSDINSKRIKYYSLIAMREFVDSLGDKMREIVGPNGPVMNYYYDKYGATSDMGRQLGFIKNNIYNELENYELNDLDRLSKKLNKDTEAYRAGELDSATSVLRRLETIIDKMNNKRIEQLSDLSAVLNRINSKQIQLNNKLNTTEINKINVNRKHDIATINSDIVKQYHGKSHKNKIMFIVMLIGTILLIGILSYKLYIKIKKELL